MRVLNAVSYAVSIGDGSAEVSGKTSVRGHYFEDGNIQLQTSKDLPAKKLPFSVGVRGMVEPKCCRIIYQTHG